MLFQGKGGDWAVPKFSLSLPMKYLDLNDFHSIGNLVYLYDKKANCIARVSNRTINRLDHHRYVHYKFFSIYDNLKHNCKNRLADTTFK